MRNLRLPLAEVLQVVLYSASPLSNSSNLSQQVALRLVKVILIHRRHLDNKLKLSRLDLVDLVRVPVQRQLLEVGSEGLVRHSNQLLLPLVVVHLHLVPNQLVDSLVSQQRRPLDNHSRPEAFSELAAD